MQSQPYMFLLAAVYPPGYSLANYQTFSPFVRIMPNNISSTSQDLVSGITMQSGYYPLAYSNFTIPCTSIQLGDQLSHLPSQHIQNDQLLPNHTPSSTTSPSHSPLFTHSECSIKIEESSNRPPLDGGFKKKPISKQPRPSSKLDRQYHPSKPERIISRKRLHENQNRNVVPNQVNQILSFIQKPNKSGHLVSRLLEKFPQRQTYNITRFYLYQALLKDKVSHYTNERSLRLINELYEPEGTIWPVQEQRYYNKLCRLLVRHFLLEDSIFIILTSKRMKSKKKIDHLRARRKVADRVFEILRGG